jgi:hypothetical protein
VTLKMKMRIIHTHFKDERFLLMKSNMAMLLDGSRHRDAETQIRPPSIAFRGGLARN